MRTISERTLKNGKRRVVVELDPSERLLPLREDAHYKLGYPVEDIVAVHILSESTRVTWCSASQEWVS